MSRPPRGAHGRLAKRVSEIVPSAIRRMSQLCEERQGIDLARGYTDEPPPQALLEVAERTIREGPNQYSITYGMKGLRQVLADRLRQFNGIDADPETEVTVTCGATEAIASSMLALVDPGDEVVIIEPYYENYVPSVLLAGGVPKFVRLRDDHELPEEDLKRTIGSRTQALIVNTPQNPTGKVYTAAELRTLADLCVDYDLTAISDETYDRFTYGEARHRSLAALKGVRERTLTVGTSSKTFFVTGWRVGFVVGPGRLSEGVRKVHDYLTVAAPTPLQHAVAAGFGFDRAYFDGLRRAYRVKRDLLSEALTRGGFRFRIPDGGYYVLADFSNLSELSDAEFAERLLTVAGIASVPGRSFYSDPAKGRTKVRFAFCKADGTLKECARRLEVPDLAERLARGNVRVTGQGGG